MQVTIDGVDYMPVPKLLEPKGTMGETLRAARKGMKLSLEAASKAIGCSKGYLWELEADSAMPGLDMAARISRAYGVPLGVLGAFALRHNPTGNAPHDAA